MLTHVTSRVRDSHGLKVPTVLLFECLLLGIFSLNTDSLSAEPPSDQGTGTSPQQVASAESSPRTVLEFIKEEESAVIAGGLYPGKPQPISKAPSNVYVITDEDIRHSGAIDLPTILRRIPGVDVMQVTGADFNVSIRGDNQLRANKLLVLVDGRSIYLDVQGEVLWKNIPVTLPEIKRIEVLKGPAAALYGFNAFDGVVNIITKSPEEIKGATLQFGGGEYGTISSAAVFAGVHGKLGYRLSYGHNQTNEWNNRNGLAFRNNLANGHIEYRLAGESKVTLQGGLVASNHYDGPMVDNVSQSQQPSQSYVNIVYDQPDFFVRTFWTGTNQPGQISPNPLQAPFFSIFGKDGTNNNSNSSNSYNLEIQHAINLGSRNRLTYGANYRHNAVSGTFLNGYAQENRLGLYFQDEWRFTETFSAVAGVRYDLDTFINPTLSPRLSLQYSPFDNHSFRAGVSVGYRPPTIFDTRTFNLGTVSFSIPNPAPPPSSFTITTPTSLTGSSNLDPEQIVSYDAGYQGWFWKHRLRVRVDMFYNHISNLIGLTALNATTLTFANGGATGLQMGGGTADIYGGEAGVEAQFTPWLSGFANYTYQEIGQTYGISTSRVARGAPRFKTNAGIRAELENGLNGEALVHYVGSSTYAIDPAFFTIAAPPFNGPPPPDPRVGSYVLVNLRGAYKFWQEKQAGREAEFAFTVFNALNDKHKEHPLGETIGSRVMGWLTIKY